MIDRKTSFRRLAAYYGDQSARHIRQGHFDRAAHHGARYLKCQRILAVICALELEVSLSGNPSFMLDGAPA